MTLLEVYKIDQLNLLELLHCIVFPHQQEKKQ